MIGNIEKPPLRRIWYKCPYCGKNALLYDNTAACQGVFFKCKNKKCEREFEVKI